MVAQLKHKERAMLILTRRPMESIRIGKDITVTIMPARGGANTRVRVGIEAPKNVVILREEKVEKRDVETPPLARRRYSPIVD